MSYVHPGTVPVACGLSIYRILHNEARVDDWETLDAWVRKDGLDKVVGLIIETLKMNGVNREVDERRWWTRELKAID